MKRYCEYQFGHWNRNQQALLQESGFHVYGLRDGGGTAYTIEPSVVCDNIGHIITDFDLTKYMERHYWTDNTGHKHESMWLCNDDFEKLIAGDDFMEVFLADFLDECEAIHQAGG